MARADRLHWLGRYPIKDLTQQFLSVFNKQVFNTDQPFHFKFHMLVRFFSHLPHRCAGQSVLPTQRRDS